MDYVRCSSGILCEPHKHRTKCSAFYPNILNEETEVQRGEVICSLPHSQDVITTWETALLQKEREDQERQKGDWEGDRDPERGQRKAGASSRATFPVETLQ